MSSISAVGTTGGSVPTTAIETLTGNTGGAVGPNGSGNVNIVGDGVVVVTTGSPGTNTITIDVNDATTTNPGVVELATDAETIAGADATRAVTPASLAAKLGTQTDNAVAIGNSTTGVINWSNQGTDGQVLIAATGANPAFATLTSSDATIIFTPGPNSLDLRASGGSGSGITVNADTGSAAPIANILNAKGAVGGNITTTGSTNNLTVAVSGTTNHAVQVGNATGSLTSVGPGANNTVLLGNTGADPSFGQVPNAALANNTISFTNGNSINISPNGPVALGSGVTIGVSGTTPNAVQVGGALGGLANVGPGTTNTVLLGNTGGIPSFGQVPNAALVNNSITVNGDANITPSGSPVALGGAVNLTFPTVNQYELITADGTGKVESLPAGTGTSGQVLTSNGAGAYPTWQTFGAPSYAEGPWFPSIVFVPFTTPCVSVESNCRFVKIGNMVHITGQVEITDQGTGSATDVLYIEGFPYNASVPNYFINTVVTQNINGVVLTIYKFNLIGTNATVTFTVNASAAAPDTPLLRGQTPRNAIFYFCTTYYTGL